MFWLTNVFPGSKGKRFGGSLILYPSPPKFSNYGVDFGNEFFGEEYMCNVVDWDGSKNRLDVGEWTSMVEFIGFDSS